MAFRWLALAVFVGALFVSGSHRRRARERETIPRRREGGAMMAARALVAFPLFISPLAYVAHPPVMAWASFDAPGWLRWVLSNLGRNVSETVLTKESHELVTSGPYRWIRHPLYTTGIALFVALGLIAANWFILLCAAAALVGIRLAVIPREERELRARDDQPLWLPKEPPREGERGRDQAREQGPLQPARCASTWTKIGRGG